MSLSTKYDPIQVLSAYRQINEDAYRLKLYFLYKKLNFVLEHLLILHGSMQDPHYKYDSQLFQKNYYSWLNTERANILKKINDYQEMMNLRD